MERRILFIHFHDLRRASGGARRTLQNFFGCSSHGVCKSYKTSGKMFYGSISIAAQDCLFADRSDWEKIVDIVEKEEIDTVFFDTCLYGSAIKYVHQKCPGIKIAVHYHNFEKQFFESDPAADKYLKRTAEKCERLASQYSDYRIFISEEDRSNVCGEYNITTEHSSVIPVMLTDAYQNQPDSALALNSEIRDSYVLFLGSSFFANNEAVDFLIRKIAPYCKKKIIVVGEKMKDSFPGQYNNTEILGFVSSLKSVMEGASAFVCPVFTGGGSKVKTAEALMYGKYIIAAPDAFIGYDKTAMDFEECLTSEDFINAINKLENKALFCQKNRELFLRDHSMDNVYEKYAFLEKL